MPTAKGFPYPSDTDPVDVPADIQALAESVDAELDDYLTTAAAAATYALKSLATNARAGSYTLVIGDAGKVVEMSGGGTLTIPTNASVAFPVGTEITVLQTGASQVTIAGTGGVTVNSAGGYLKIAAQWSAVTLIKRAADTWVAVGALVA
jgi:hypothetical protein